MLDKIFYQTLLIKCPEYLIYLNKFKDNCHNKLLFGCASVQMQHGNSNNLSQNTTPLEMILYN